MKKECRWVIDSSVIMKDKSVDDVNLVIVNEVDYDNTQETCDSLFCADKIDIRSIDLPKRIIDRLSKRSFDVIVYILALFREIDIYNSRRQIGLLEYTKAIRISIFHFGVEEIYSALDELLKVGKECNMSEEADTFRIGIFNYISMVSDILCMNTCTFPNKNKIILMQYSSKHHFIDSFYEI